MDIRYWYLTLYLAHKDFFPMFESFDDTFFFADWWTSLPLQDALYTPNHVTHLLAVSLTSYKTFLLLLFLAPRTFHPFVVPDSGRCVAAIKLKMLHFLSCFPCSIVNKIWLYEIHKSFHSAFFLTFLYCAHQSSCFGSGFIYWLSY